MYTELTGTLRKILKRHSQEREGIPIKDIQGGLRLIQDGCG